MQAQAQPRPGPGAPVALRFSDHLLADREREGADFDALATSRQVSPLSPTQKFAEIARPVCLVTPSAVVREISPSGDGKLYDRMVAAQRLYRQMAPVNSRHTIHHVSSQRVSLAQTRSSPSQTSSQTGNAPEEASSPTHAASHAALRGNTNRSPHVVTRQFTPLSYRVKDHISEGDDENGEDSPTTAAMRASRKVSPVGLSRNLDRERHGGAEPTGPPAPQEPVRVECAQQQQQQQDDGRGVVRPCKLLVTPTLNSRSPSPQGTPAAMVRAWSLERDRLGAAEAIRVALPQELRASSPVLPAGGGRQSRAARPVSRLHSRSPTPNGTPIMLSRDADRERHGFAPVTIWRGMDQERLPSPRLLLESETTPELSCRASLGSPVPGAVALAASAAAAVGAGPRLSSTTPLSSPQLGAAELVEVASLASPVPGDRMRHRNLAEALVQAAVGGKVRISSGGGGSPRDEAPAPKAAVAVAAPLTDRALPPSGSVALPPSASGMLPPSGSVALPPNGSVALPPSGSVALPPSGSVALPPSASGALPPSGSAALPPSASRAQPTSASGAPPPSVSGVPPPCGSVVLPASASMRKSLTPTRKGFLGTGPPLSSRSTLPASFRPQAMLAAAAKAAGAPKAGAPKIGAPKAGGVQPQSQTPTHVQPPPAMHSASVRVLSPGLSPRAPSGLHSVPSPHLAFPKGQSCYPSGSATLPMSSAPSPAPPTMRIPVSGTVRVNPGNVTVNRLGSHLAHQ